MESLKTLTLIVFMLPAFANSETRSRSILEQNVGEELTKTVGQAIFRLKRERPLQNAFGGRDIFGGKIDEGFLEVRYIGMSKTKNPKFRITDKRKTSTETTMTRYGQKPLVNVQVGNNDSSDQDVTEFEHDLKDGNELEFDNYKIKILKVTGSQIKYEILDE